MLWKNRKKNLKVTRANYTPHTLYPSPPFHRFHLDWGQWSGGKTPLSNFLIFRRSTGGFMSVIRVKRSFCTVLVCHYDTVKSTLQLCWNLCKNSRNSLNINHLHTIYSNPTYQFRNYTTKTYHKICNNIPKSANRH